MPWSAAYSGSHVHLGIAGPATTLSFSVSLGTPSLRYKPTKYTWSKYTLLFQKTEKRLWSPSALLFRVTNWN